MENSFFVANENLQSEDKDEPNKQSDHIYEIHYSGDKRLLDSIESNENASEIDTKLLKDYTESPRTKLARFLHETPFKIDGNLTQLCDSKVFVKTLDLKNGNKNFHVSLSLNAEHNDDDEQPYTKNCDCNDDIIQSLQPQGSTISRSISEDFLQQPSTTFERRISLLSTVKGKLMGVPRVWAGEKLVRSPSVGTQVPFRVLTRMSIEKEDLQLKPKFTTEQKLVVFCLCLVDFAAFLSVSIIAPFFPREAAQKGMCEAVSGFVFSIYSLVVMLFSPVFGKILPSVGAKFMFLVGVGFCGTCNVLFGLLDKVNGQMEFTVLCFLVRSFEALGAAAYCTASCTILIDQFPDDIGTVFSFTETSIGLGLSIGPAVGGALYAVGGFGLPFLTLGCCVILIVPLCWYLLRNVEDSKVVLSSTVSYKKLLSMPHVVIVCIILVVSSQVEGFIDPTLEPHMRQYNLDTSIIGLLFLLLSGTYTISSAVVGWVSGKVENKYPIMIVGLILVTIAMLLLGPSVFISIDGSLWLSVAALALMGFSLAAAYVPTFESMFIATMNGGLEDDINTYGVVSGLWNSLFSLGQVTGPSLGGILSDFFTFPEASSVMAFSTLTASVISLIAWINPWQCFGPYSLIEDAEEKMVSAQGFQEIIPIPSREHTPLQDGNVHTYGSLWEDKNDPVV